MEIFFHLLFLLPFKALGQKSCLETDLNKYYKLISSKKLFLKEELQEAFCKKPNQIKVIKLKKLLGNLT